MEELELLKGKYYDLLIIKMPFIEDHEKVIKTVKILLNKYDFYMDFPSFVVDFDGFNRLVEKIKQELNHLNFLCLSFEKELEDVIHEILGWFEGFIVMKKLFEEK